MWQGSVCGGWGDRGSAASREGIGRARCGTPPPPAAAPPLAGEALEVCGGGRGRPLAGGCSCAGEIWRCAALCNDARLLRRAFTPALHCGRERAATGKRQFAGRPGGGPMQSIGPYAGMWRGSVCGEPGGYWQGAVRHPSAACGGTSPCRGGFGGLRRGHIVNLRRRRFAVW